MFGNINNCHNVKDFRNLAKKRLPSPIFHYIDGAADDEITYKRNTDAYEQCDLIPNVLSGGNGTKVRYAFVLCTNRSSTIVSS